MSASISTSRRRIDVARPRLYTEVKTIPNPLPELKDLSSRVATLTRLVQQDLGQIITRAQGLSIVIPSHVLELQSRQIQARSNQRNLVFEDSGVRGFNVVGLDGEKKTRQNTSALLLPRRNLPRIIQDETLPVLHLVFTMLPARQTLPCRRVCKQFNLTISSNLHWRARTVLRFRDLTATFIGNHTRIFTNKYLPLMINVRLVELGFGTFNMDRLGPCALLKDLTLIDCVPHIILGESVFMDSPSYVAETKLYNSNTTNLDTDWKQAMTRYVAKTCPGLRGLKRLRVEVFRLPSYELAGPSRNPLVIPMLFLGWVSSILQMTETSLDTFEWQLELVERKKYVVHETDQIRNSWDIQAYLSSRDRPLRVYNLNSDEPDKIQLAPGWNQDQKEDQLKALSIKNLLGIITLPSSLRTLLLNNGYRHYFEAFVSPPTLVSIAIQCPNLETLSIYQVPVDYQDFKNTLAKLPLLKTFNTDVQFSAFGEDQYGLVDFNKSNPLLENLSWMGLSLGIGGNIQDILLQPHLQRFVMLMRYVSADYLAKIEKLEHASLKPSPIEFRVKRSEHDYNVSQRILPMLDTRRLEILECFSNAWTFGQEVLASHKYPELTHMIMCGTGSFNFPNIGPAIFPKLTHYYQEAYVKTYGITGTFKWNNWIVDALEPINQYITKLPTLRYATLDMTFRDGPEQDDFKQAARPPPLTVLNDMASYFKENSNLLEFALVYYTYENWPMWIQFVRYSTAKDFEIRHHVHGVVPQIWPFQHTSYTDPSCETLLHTIDETKNPAQLEYDQDDDDDKVLEIKQGASRSGNTRARMVHDVGHVPVALGHVTIPGDAMVYNGDTIENIHVLPNEVFVIRLASNPTTGYEWRQPRQGKNNKLPFITSGLTYLDKEYYTIGYDKRPGTGGYDYWAFQADELVKLDKLGKLDKLDYKTCRVNLEYSRGWEKDVLQDVTLTIVISTEEKPKAEPTTSSPPTTTLPIIHSGRVIQVLHGDEHTTVTLVDKNGKYDAIDDYLIAEIRKMTRSSGKNMSKAKPKIQSQGKDQNTSIIEITESDRGEIRGALFQNPQVAVGIKQLKPGDQVEIIERSFPVLDTDTTFKVDPDRERDDASQERLTDRLQAWTIQDLVKDDDTIKGVSHAGRKGGGHSRERHASASRDKVGYVMHEFKHHELHSGSHNGPIVTNPKQAIAIALSYKRRGH